jgi:hypothetical protein
MGVNQNSSPQFGLCSKINPKPLSSNPIKNRLAIAELSASGTGLGTVTKTLRGANKITQEIDNNNSTQNSLSPSRAFHRTLDGRVREPAAGEQFRPQNLETFDTMARDTTGDHLQASRPRSLQLIIKNVSPAAATTDQLL